MRHLPNLVSHSRSVATANPASLPADRRHGRPRVGGEMNGSYRLTSTPCLGPTDPASAERMIESYNALPPIVLRFVSLQSSFHRHGVGGGEVRRGCM